MKLTKDILNDLGFNNKTNDEFFWQWEFMYYFNSQELYALNDGYGDPVFITKIKDRQHLIDVCYLYDKTDLLIDSDKKTDPIIVDKLSIVYDYLIDSEDSIVEKNKYLILFTQHTIHDGDFETIEKFVDGIYFFDIDISILCSMSIIIRQFYQLENCNSKLQRVIDMKLKNNKNQ